MLPVNFAILSMVGNSLLPQVRRRLPRSKAVALPPKQTMLISSFTVSLRTNAVLSNSEACCKGAMSISLFS